MVEFYKELETIKELLTDAYNKGLADGIRKGERGAFDKGEVYRHQRLEDKGIFFNVGDVVCTTTNFDWEGIKVFNCGTVGTIIKKHKSDAYGIMLYTVEAKSEDGDKTINYLYGTADLELVTPAKPSVKVGSIVKIVKEYNDYSPSTKLFSKGTLGVITEIKEGFPEKSTNGRYKYKVETSNDEYYYDRDCFEVIEKIEEGK